MKSFRVLGLAAALLSVSLMPATVWSAEGNRGGRRNHQINGKNDNHRWNNNQRMNRNRWWNNNDNGGTSYWTGGPWSFYPWGPYSPDYRVDYSVNTPSRQSRSPYQIPLNDGVHVSPLDPGYDVPRAVVGGYAIPYAAPEPVLPPGNYAPAPAPVAEGPEIDLVVGVQRELRRLGYYRGMVNGISDARTRSAIRAYESRMGMPVTGVMGSTLVRSLGIQ